MGMHTSSFSCERVPARTISTALIARGFSSSMVKSTMAWSVSFLSTITFFLLLNSYARSNLALLLLDGLIEGVRQGAHLRLDLRSGRGARVAALLRVVIPALNGVELADICEDGRRPGQYWASEAGELGMAQRP